MSDHLNQQLLKTSDLHFSETCKRRFCLPERAGCLSVYLWVHIKLRESLSLLQSLVTLTCYAFQRPSGLLDLPHLCPSFSSQAFAVHRPPPRYMFVLYIMTKYFFFPFAQLFLYLLQTSLEMYSLLLLLCAPDSSRFIWILLSLMYNKKLLSKAWSCITVVSLMCSALTPPYPTTEVFEPSVYCSSLYNS